MGLQKGCISIVTVKALLHFDTWTPFFNKFVWQIKDILHSCTDPFRCALYYQRFIIKIDQ